MPNLLQTYKLLHLPVASCVGGFPEDNVVLQQHHQEVPWGQGATGEHQEDCGQNATKVNQQVEDSGDKEE